MVCSQGDVVVIPGGTEHEAWFRDDTEVIDFFAPPRAEFLLGGKPAYMREDNHASNQSGADEIHLEMIQPGRAYSPAPSQFSTKARPAALPL